MAPMTEITFIAVGGTIILLLITISRTVDQIRDRLPPRDRDGDGQ